MNTLIEIEDQPKDIIAKAQRGLGIADDQLAQLCGISPQIIYELKEGSLNESALLAVSVPLGLDGNRLIQLGSGKWYPKPTGEPYLRQITTTYHSLTVNAYLVWDSFTNKAILFDTGTSTDDVLNALSANKLELDAIMLTHGHQDHIMALKTISTRTGAEIYAPIQEAIPDTHPIEEGQKFRLGKLAIFPISTPGHTAFGFSYKIEGLNTNVIICGDTLFAGSVGGVRKHDYLNALATIREKILSQPERTLLCPGHGPMTSVIEEINHNPFFPKTQ